MRKIFNYPLCNGAKKSGVKKKVLCLDGIREL